MAEINIGSAGVTSQQMSDALAALPRGRALYTASASDAVVGNNSSVRATMLPVDATTGISGFVVPANTMPVGSHILLMGTGLIGAATAAPGTFTLTPWVAPQGGSKIDLPGFSYAPLLGADGICEIWMKITQTPTGVRTGGIVRYGVANGQAYSISLNPGTTSVLPTIIASDSTVSRTFGVDGQWATASAANYVRCRQVTVVLFPAS